RPFASAPAVECPGHGSQPVTVDNKRGTVIPDPKLVNWGGDLLNITAEPVFCSHGFARVNKHRYWLKLCYPVRDLGPGPIALLFVVICVSERRPFGRKREIGALVLSGL